MSQPNKPYYGIEELLLFPRHTRATYLATFGKQAPKWDKAKQIKRWATKDKPEGANYGYDYFDPIKTSFQIANIPSSEAQEFNLPGKFDYPKWMPAPTPAVVVGGSSEQSVNADWLSTKEEADALALELAETGFFTVGKVSESQFVSGTFRYDWRGETRRQWAIRIGGDDHTVSLILKRKHAGGVGAPGHWFGNDMSGPMWARDTEDTGDMDSRPEIPAPYRQLLANERLHIDPFKVLVVRTDIESELNPTTPDPAGTGGGLTTKQAAQLERIDLAVIELLGR